MKKFGFFFPLAILLCPTVTHAEAITDGSVGAVKSLSGNFEIPASLGTTSGTNLFHSFQMFNINSGESATFTGSNNITNVISRVTGGKVSTIDGALRSQIGKADFYFINPAGMVFGKDAKLDVPASFYASTENSLRFKDGVNYSAADLKNNALSISTPEQFGMLDANGQNNSLLEINGAKLSVKDAQTLGIAAENINVKGNAQLNADGGKIVIAATNQTNLSDSLVNAQGNGQGKIAISAKDATIENSIVTASNTGAVDMKAGEGVSITTSNLKLMDHSQISADSYDLGSAGNVNIKATGNVEIKTGSVISSHSLAAGKGGEVNFTAATLNLDGKDQSDTDFTGIAANANPNSTSQAGKVNVQVDSLNIENGAQMNSSTFGEGDANSVSVTAKNITIDGKGSAFATGIGSNANPDSSGNAGNIAIKADNVNIFNGGTINSATFSSGDAGNVQIDAKNVMIDGQNNKNKVTGISSDTDGRNGGVINTGNAGEVVLNVTKLTMKNYGSISSRSIFSSGKGGAVKVKSDDIYINGYANEKPNQQFVPTGILADTSPLRYIDENGNLVQKAGAGNAGDIYVDANTIKIIEEGRIASNSDFSSGKAGNVNVQAKNIMIDGNTKATPFAINEKGEFILDEKGNKKYKDVLPTGIESNTLFGSTGDAGTVKINASDILIEEGGRIATNTRGQGKAGSLAVNANNITIDAKIYSVDDLIRFPRYISGIAAAASPTSSGYIGNVDVSAAQALTIKNSGQISIQNRATVEHPKMIPVGTISVKAGDVYLQNYSLINAQSTVNADASNIRAQLARGLWLDNSAITTQAESGNGGAISINSGDSINMEKSIVTTSVKSSTGNGGNITVLSPNLVLNDGVIQANAYSGNGGDVLLVIDSLVGSREQVQQAGKKIDIFLPNHTPEDISLKGAVRLQIEDANTKMWADSSFKLRNLIQAASEHGLSGQVTVTSPQINLSGVLAGLSTEQFDRNILRQDYCSIGTGSSLTNKGYGVLPAKPSDLLY